MTSRIDGIGTLILGLVAGCGTKYAQTATRPDEQPLLDASNIPVCGNTLASRLAITTIDLDEDVRYKREGYNYIPTDARIAFSVAPSGNSYVAWTNDAATSVHVTPLTALQGRLGPDTQIAGHEVGGLVAQNDGFTLLLAQDDPETQLVNPNPIVQPSYGLAAVAVRIRQGASAPVFSVPLTGMASVVNAAAPLHDCTSDHFDGRLAFNGRKYGAYFTVHGCQGDVHEGYYADKLGYFDDQGQAVTGGWNWGCQIDLDLRLLPQTDSFTTLCMADTASGAGGVTVVRENLTLSLLAPEFARGNVAAGQFGSLIQLPDGSFLLLWLSRGGPNADNAYPLRPANDIAMMRISAAPDFTVSPITWLTTTPLVHELNLHVAPYGPSALLMAWDAVESVDCSRVDFHVTCFGTYAGTHFQLIDLQGKAMGPDEILPAPPNERDDLAVFPNGDVGWAYVPDAGRNYASPLAGALSPLNSNVRVPSVPSLRKIDVARLLYCP